MLKQSYFLNLFILAFVLTAGCSKDKDKPKNKPVVFEADIDDRHWIADSIKVFRYPGYSNYGQNTFAIVAFTKTGESIQLHTRSDMPSVQTFRNVTLLQFTAEKDIRNSNDVVLRWSTSMEMNAARFEIERSADGIHFSKVGEVPATGNTNIETHYSWREKPSVVNLTYYYRLRIVNSDNTAAFSRVTAINISTVAAYFSADSDTAYHYGFDGNITLSTTDTIHHTISGSFFFDFVDDSGGVKHKISNGMFKDIPY